MTEGRLPIYQAADKILDILLENRAVNANRRLTRQEVLAATGLDQEMFGAAYEHLRSQFYVMAPISEEEMWVTPQGSSFHFRERTHNILDAYSKSLENFGRSLQQPNPPSFGSSNILNNYGTINDSQIQQGTTDSSQTGWFTSTSIDELRCLLDEILASIPSLALNAVDKEGAESAIAAVETQLDSPLSDQGFIRKSLESVKRIIEGATGSAIGSGLALRIAQFIDHMDAA